MDDEQRSRSSKCDDQASWSDLPSLVLENMYSFLSRSDQVNMSLVSPNWSRLYESPSLWKSFRFTMNKSNMKNNACSLMNCVHKYSRYFKHVGIFFKEGMDEEMILIWLEHFKTFLQILTNTSQIVSVEFHYLAKFFQSMDIETCNNIRVDLAHFLGSLSNLKRLEFYGSYFEDKDGVYVLKESFENCENSLKTLVLQDFLHCSEDKQDPCVDQLLPSILSLQNLSHLEIDYWLIFGKGRAILSDANKKLKNCRKETYLKILINVDDLLDFDDFKLLTSNDWRQLKRQYPFLDIDLLVDHVSASEIPVKFLIMEHMPISILSYNVGYRSFKLSLEIEIDAFLNHIIACKINTDLVSFTLHWLKPINDVALVFMPFLKVCKKLKRLELNVVYPSNNLDVLLESLLNDKPPSLEEFELTIWDVEEEQVNPLRNLGSEFESLLKPVNLNFKLLVE